MRILRILFIVIWFAVLLGCQPKVPREALTLSPESLQQRQVQTRRFETNDENKVLSACAALLLDTGFNINKSETKLGLIAASKDRDATDAGQIAGSILLSIITYGNVNIPFHDRQRMVASVVTYPSGEERKNITVRVTFQRIVWDKKNNEVIREGLADPSIYQEFFAKLSKSLFLEANEI